MSLNVNIDGNYHLDGICLIKLSSDAKKYINYFAKLQSTIPSSKRPISNFILHAALTRRNEYNEWEIGLLFNLFWIHAHACVLACPLEKRESGFSCPPSDSLVHGQDSTMSGSWPKKWIGKVPRFSFHITPPKPIQQIQTDQICRQQYYYP